VTTFQSSALFTEDETSEFVAQLLDFGWILGASKAFGKFKEGPFFLLTGLKSQFHQFHQDTIAAEAALPCNAFYLAVEIGRKGHTAPNLFVHCHNLLCYTIMVLTGELAFSRKNSSICPELMSEYE